MIKYSHTNTIKSCVNREKIDSQTHIQPVGLCTWQTNKTLLLSTKTTTETTTMASSSSTSCEWKWTTQKDWKMQKIYHSHVYHRILSIKGISLHIKCQYGWTCVAVSLDVRTCCSSLVLLCTLTCQFSFVSLFRSVQFGSLRFNSIVDVHIVTERV